uniref:Ribosomal protein L18 n=1 Tax=Seculamonas ecuadoriensis TaxID=221724 RepID=M4QEJ9_SECEC|nr:ribosomal protein L18 [Seculamonas ecuadoriensis]AGH24515.1 ribosomal protein L18 [Seculamonas ecuadoriensis]
MNQKLELQFNLTNKHMYAILVHKNNILISLSTQDPYVVKALAHKTDHFAARFIAQRFAQRVIESGLEHYNITFIRNKIFHGKLKTFIATLQQNKIINGKKQK